MTIISEFTGSPAIPELGLKTVDLKLEVHSFQTDFRDLQTLDRIFRPVFGFGTRVYRGISCCSAGLRPKLTFVSLITRSFALLYHTGRIFDL